MKVWVVLPAYNEAQNIAAIIDGFQNVVEDNYNFDIHIILVNDGSTDNTSEIARQSAGKLPIDVYENEKNQGLAETFMRGMTIAARKAKPKDVIICMDADNSHSPGLTLRMVRNIQEGRDVVIASRYQPGAVAKGIPLRRRILSRVMSLLFRMVYPIKGVKDYSCGYRAYRAEFLQKALEAQGELLFPGEGFACMAGILLALGRQGAICGEVPIILRYDQKASSSKMKIGQTIGRTLRMLIHERFRS
jgi:dolichol-phosphate mannosyltransferase